MQTHLFINKLRPLLIVIIFCLPYSVFAQQGSVYGYVKDIQNENISDVVVNLKGISNSNLFFSTNTSDNGYYHFSNIPYGVYLIEFDSKQYVSESFEITVNKSELSINQKLNITLLILDIIEVFGAQNKVPEKLDAITRLPLLPNEQIQSISIISDKVIEAQGNLSISEASRNVSGVYTYATFGGVRESMSSRGFRGIPILKNGVRIQSDFRGAGFATDFAGVESIQIIKGASSVTMGAATDLGSPGGVINIVTKTPKFINKGVVNLRLGSFNQYRPSFDIQNTIGENKKLAFRINGAYENSRTFHNISGIGQNKIYLNPSLAWHPDSKTEFVFEMDYLDDSRSFDPGTVNLSINNSENNIFDLPVNRYLGFVGNTATQLTRTYTGRFKHDLNNKLYLQGAVFYADYKSDAIVSSLKSLDKNDSLAINTIENTLYKRSIGKNNTRLDKNLVIQLDLVGQKIQTGKLKHTFQIGLDYRATNVTTFTYNSLLVDTINIREIVNNTIPEGVPNFTLLNEDLSRSNSMGMLAQEVMEIGKYLRLFGGVRFGVSNSSTPLTNIVATDYFINPIGGVMVKIWKDVNLFGSYTNSTNPRTAEYKDNNGNPLGHETISQFETGFKSSWHKDRLRFNATYYFITNKGMNIQAAIENPITGLIELQNYYFKGGNDERKGLELELTGRLYSNLELIIGYAYIDAKYKEHTTFVPGSKPNNTPNHTINAYVNYRFEQIKYRGLSIGVGYYYIGERPYNDWTQSNVQFHGITPNLEPWNNKAYMLLNAQIGYDFKNLKTPILNQFNVRLIGNNLLNSIGYDAYRTSFINRIDPINFSFNISYRL